jgi:hypothetical protein
MAISFVAAATPGYQNGGTSVTATLPASAAVGDVVLAYGALSEVTVGDPSISGGGGGGSWVQVGSTTDDNTCRTKVWRRVVVSGDAGATITMSWTSSAKGGLMLVAYRGVHTTTPINASATEAETGTDTTHNAPGVTPSVANCWIAEYVAQRSGVCTTITAPGGRTERAEQLGGGSGTVCQIAADSNAAVTSGSPSGSATYTFDASTANAVGWSIALAPAPTAVSDELSRVTGTGVARPLTASRSHALGRVTATGVARALTTLQGWPLGRVTGAGIARPLTVSTGSAGQVLMPELSIQVAFSVGADTGTLLHLDDPTRGKLDTGTLGDGTEAEPTFVELADRFNEDTARIERGSQRVDTPILRYETGSATVPLDNHDRALDPSNLDGPYVEDGDTQVTAMRAVRIRATWDNVVYELLRGTADVFNVAWKDPGHSITTLIASDAMKILAGIDRAAVPAVGADEDTGARINRILDSAGWGAEDRMVDEGDSLVQATTLAGDALAELQLVADTEIGELFVDGGGRVVFRHRNAILTDTRSNTSQGTFGDATGELPYKDLQIATDDATFFNEVRVTRASTGEGDTPVEQTVDDTASQVRFYRRTFTPPAPPIVRTDTDAQAYAQWLLGVSSEPELRFTQMVLEPAVQPAELWPQALGRQIGDRITVKRRPPGGGDPIVMDCFIRGIVHEFGREEWLTTFTLQSAQRYGGFLVLDHETLGRLDENALAY